MPPTEKHFPRPNVGASPTPGSPSWRGDHGSTQIAQGAAAGNANEFALVPLKGSG